MWVRRGVGRRKTIDTLATFLLLVTALLLGLVHGLDWDHIAAIADITATTTRPRRGILLASVYAGGHAAVVLTLGVAALAFGTRLPEWIDGIMEPLVGITLIFLSIYIILSMLRNSGDFRMRSRWMLLLDGTRALIRLAVGKRVGPGTDTVIERSSLGIRTAFTIGMLHGIGAATPSQILLFVTAGGVGDALLGSLVVLVFTSGLLVANSLLAVLSIFGLAEARRKRRVWMGAGALTAAISLVVGVTFLLGQSGILPSFTILG